MFDVHLIDTIVIKEMILAPSIVFMTDLLSTIVFALILPYTNNLNIYVR